MTNTIRPAALGGNSRNGTRSKTVLTEIGPVQIEVPRDRDGSFDPQVVRKRQRRPDGIDQIVLSLTARGLTTGEIAAHFDEVYGAKVSKDTISRITDKVVEEMTEWRNQPLDRVYPVLFIDAIIVKVRDGQVANRPVNVVIGVTVNGERDILGLWAGDGGEGAKFWLAVLTEIKNRGVADACIVVCDCAQRPARLHRHRVALCPDPCVHPAPDPQHLPVCLPPRLGRDGPRLRAGLYRGERRDGRRPVR
jgi:putative transposase